MSFIQYFTKAEDRRVFIFHHNDLDGYAGGAVVYKYVTEELGFEKEKVFSKAITYPTHEKTLYINNVPEPTKNDYVIVVDYSFTKLTKKYLNEIAEKAFGTLWIDHHKTSLEICYDTDCTKDSLIYLEDNKVRLGTYFYKIVNMDYSGALLAYKLLYPNIKVPQILKYVDDYDRWVHKYPESKKVNAGFTAIDSYKDITSSYWKLLLCNKNVTDEKHKKLEEFYLKFLITTGSIVLNYDRERYENIVKTMSYFVKIEHFPQYNVLAINAKGNSAVFCNRLEDEDVDIGLLYYYDGYKYCYSIYSTKEDVDVSEIAKYFGGGGHKGAAGFFTTGSIIAEEICKSATNAER